MIGKRRRIRRQLNSNTGYKDPKYLASCYGKLRRTKQEAHAEAALMPDMVKAYRCHYCENYHIGRRQ